LNERRFIQEAVKMHDEKAVIRRQAYTQRNAQQDKERLSEVIFERFIGQTAYQQAETVMWYVHCRSEVRTLPALSAALENQQKRVVIPYCTKDDAGHNILGLWWLQDLSELTAGTWGILEPPAERWGEKVKQIDPAMLDLIMVPGVGFDRQGGRIGNGAGYYDRLFTKVRADAVLSSVCYEVQLFAQIPMQAHDVYMDYVITEQAVYQGVGRRGFNASHRKF
jgi:5-formyltetrahydrofolate cyclo-ligase